MYNTKNMSFENTKHKPLVSTTKQKRLCLTE